MLQNNFLQLVSLLRAFVLSVYIMRFLSAISILACKDACYREYDITRMTNGSRVCYTKSCANLKKKSSNGDASSLDIRILGDR